MNFNQVKNYYENAYSSSIEAFRLDKKRYASWVQDLPKVAQEDSKHLDIGCGAGDVCDDMFRRGFKTFGVDISERALDLAKKKCPDGHFTLSLESNELAFEDGVFNLITCFGVLEHIRQPEKIVQECVRIMCIGADAILSCQIVCIPYFWFGGPVKFLKSRVKKSVDKLIREKWFKCY